jgi:hypothetical protein
MDPTRCKVYSQISCIRTFEGLKKIAQASRRSASGHCRVTYTKCILAYLQAIFRICRENTGLMMKDLQL